MINVQQAVFATEERPSAGVVLQAEFALTANLMLDKQDVTESETIREAKNHLRHFIWDAAYGDLAQKIAELERLVVGALLDYDRRESVRRVFAELTEMLKFKPL